MAIPKRVALTPVEPQKTPAPRSKIIRLNITLGESNRHTCPIINYEKLIAEERAKREREGGTAQPTNNPFNGCGNMTEADEKENLKKIAEKFEEKYGGGANKRKRCQTYAELGAGYDENDSFIDNTEAFEEGLPANLDTKHGGYYINIGPIQLRKVDHPINADDDFRPKTKKVVRKIIESTTSEESSSSSSASD